MKRFLKELSQAFFFQDPLFGAGLLALLVAFDPWMGACGLAAALVGHFHSLRFSVPRLLKEAGLMPLNGLFFGLALASLFGPSPLFYFCLLVGSLVIPLLTQAAFEVFQHWRLSPFVLPYILTVWLITLCSHGTALPPHGELQAGELVSGWLGGSAAAPALSSVLQGAGRLLFIPHPLFGLLLIGLVSVFSPRRGAYFVLGTLTSTAAGFLLSGGSSLWEEGRLSACAGLMALALASFPENFTARRILLFSALSAFVTLALQQLLDTRQLPILSLPYLLTLWLALLSRLPRMTVSWGRSSIRSP